MDINIVDVFDKYFSLLEKTGYFPTDKTIQLVMMVYVDKLLQDMKDKSFCDGTVEKVHKLIHCLEKNCLV